MTFLVSKCVRHIHKMIRSNMSAFTIMNQQIKLCVRYHMREKTMEK